MRVMYVGHFNAPHSTESHVRQALVACGHDVVPVQENEADWADLAAIAADEGAEFVLWTHTRDYAPPDTYQAQFRFLDRCRVPVVGFHLDLWFGLRRAHLVNEEPFFRVDLLVSADGGHQAEFEAAGVNHRWMPPGVSAFECEPGTPRDEYRTPVVFVGSHQGGYHPESRHRTELVRHLRRRRDVTFWPRPGEHAVRGDNLRDLYASAGMAVGDSCNVGTRGFPGRYWCADEQTEILTHRGWLTCDEVQAGDLAYTVRPDDLAGEWQPVNAVTVFPREQRTMLSLEGERHSSLTTLDHRWLVDVGVRERDSMPETCPECGYRSSAADPLWGVSLHRAKSHGVKLPERSRTKRGRTWRTSATLGSNGRIPVAAPCVNLPTVPKWDDALVELVAWVWTEGSVRRNVLGDAIGYTALTQSHRVNGPYCARIRRCLTDLFGAERESLRDVAEPAWAATRNDSRGLTVFRLSAAASRLLHEIVPNHLVSYDFIAQLTAAQLLLFVETSVDADGCRKRTSTHGTETTSTTIAQKDRRRLGPFEMACALLGRGTGASFDPATGHWLITVKKRSFTAPLREGNTAKAEQVVHDGRVWCPSTSNGTWLARRRGTVYFTGNSDRVPETMGRGCLLIHPWVEGMDEHYEPGKHFVDWTAGRWAQLHYWIDYFKANPDRAAEIAAAGREHTIQNHTYTARMGQLVDLLRAERLL